LLLLGSAAAAGPQEKFPSGAIDTEKSRMTVEVGTSGFFSAFGHEHTVRAPIRGGQVSTGPPAVELVVDARKMQVADPDISEKDRAEIQRDMHTKVLESERFPEIRFRSTKVDRRGDSWNVSGELALHGQTRPVTVTVKQRGNGYVGEAKLKQSEFGIKPVSAGGGAVKVKDELKIAFEIQVNAPASSK
jgi:hypothetical protein